MPLNPRIAAWKDRRVWLVGASTGIGAALARVLLARGAKVAVSARSAGRLRALVAGRFAVSCDDVREVAKSALRHRVMINFHGISEGITPDRVIEAVLAEVRQPNVPAGANV